MSRVSFEQLLEAGAHFGHLTRKWNPAMAPYIFMERNGIHIIDLYKTVAKLDEAAEAMKKMASQGKTILFVATKKQAKEPLAEVAKSVDMPFVVERWPGGMLTNFPTIRKAVRKMDEIDRMSKDGTFDNLSKREKLQISRQREKLERTLGSIAGMKTLPSALMVVDVCKEHIAVKEARRLGIPVFAIVDTNADPRIIDYPVPANDDATDSIALVLKALAEAIAEGLMEYQAEKREDKEKDKNEEEEGVPQRRERRSRTGLRRERVHRNDTAAAPEERHGAPRERATGRENAGTEQAAKGTGSVEAREAAAPAADEADHETAE